MLYISDKKLRDDYLNNLRRKSPDKLTENEKDILRYQHVKEELESEGFYEN